MQYQLLEKSQNRPFFMFNGGNSGMQMVPFNCVSAPNKAVHACIEHSPEFLSGLHFGEEEMFWTKRTFSWGGQGSVFAQGKAYM